MPKSEVFFGFFWAYRRQRRGTRALDVAVPEPKRLGEGGVNHGTATAPSHHSHSTVAAPFTTQSQSHSHRHGTGTGTRSHRHGHSARSQRTVTAHGHSKRSRSQQAHGPAHGRSTRPSTRSKHTAKAHGHAKRPRNTCTARPPRTSSAPLVVSAAASAVAPASPTYDSAD